MQQHHKKKIFQWTAGVLACFIVSMVLGAFWLYSGTVSGSRLRVFLWLGTPLGAVGSEYITAQDLQYFSLSNGAVSGARALANNLQLESLAASLSVHVSSRDLETAAAALKDGDAQYGGFEARYGHAAALRVLARPYMYETYLRIAYMKQGMEPAFTQQLQSVYAKLHSDEDWKNIAATESGDTATSWSGGDTGYIDLTLAIPEYATAVQGMPIHSPAVIYTRYGAHIVEVLHRVPKDGKEFTRLREIVLRPQGFETWLAEQTKAVPVKWYVHIPASID